MSEQKAEFGSFEQSTKEDWGIINRESKSFQKGLARRVLTHLELLSGDYGGFPVDRLEHSLQTATRAHQDGRDEEYVVCALLHDIGDTLGCYNHPDVAAAILEPFVSEENHWLVAKHGIFQGYYFFHHLGLDRDMREQFRGHQWFDPTALFCEKYDQPSFDKDFQSMPLEAFAPMVERVFEQPKRSIYRRAE